MPAPIDKLTTQSPTPLIVITPVEELTVHIVPADEVEKELAPSLFSVRVGETVASAEYAVVV